MRSQRKTRMFEGRPSKIAILILSLMLSVGASRHFVAGLDAAFPTGWVVVGADSAQLVSRHGCWKMEEVNGHTRGVCGNSLEESYMPKVVERALVVSPGQHFLIRFDSVPSTVRAQSRGATLSLESLTAPDSPGRYRYDVHATWPGGNGDFVFQLRVDTASR